MCKEPEDEPLPRPAPSPRVEVTPEWLAENAEKRRRYERERAAWLATLQTKDE